MFKHLAAFFIIAVLFIGCSSKSEECVAPTIEKNLVGTWKAVILEDGKATDGRCLSLVLSKYLEASSLAKSTKRLEVFR